MTLGQKIKYLRNAANMMQIDLAKQLNISNGTMSKYESDQLEANVSVLREICKIFNVTADYLIDEENITPVSPPRLSPDEVDLINKVREKGSLEHYALNEREYQIIQMYRQLPSEEKGEVRGLIRGFLLHKNREKVSDELA